MFSAPSMGNKFKHHRIFSDQSDRETGLISTNQRAGALPHPEGGGRGKQSDRETYAERIESLDL